MQPAQEGRGSKACCKLYGCDQIMELYGCDQIMAGSMHAHRAREKNGSGEPHPRVNLGEGEPYPVPVPGVKRQPVRKAGGVPQLRLEGGPSPDAEASDTYLQVPTRLLP